MMSTNETNCSSLETCESDAKRALLYPYFFDSGQLDYIGLASDPDCSRSAVYHPS